ncbi:hypothetical protein D3C78_1571290 [compost metagenome]
MMGGVKAKKRKMSGNLVVENRVRIIAKLLLTDLDKLLVPLISSLTGGNEALVTKITQQHTIIAEFVMLPVLHVINILATNPVPCLLVIVGLYID